MPDAISRPTSSAQTVSGAEIDYGRLGIAIAVAGVVAAAVFLIWPSIDLAFSRLFYVEGKGFPIDRNPVAVSLRWVVWRMTDAMILASVAGLILAAFGRTVAGIGARVWGFVLLLYVLGPGLIVNVVLKDHWGRARPNSVTDFGGDRTFTPPILIADQCDTNCSFVSGEGAAAVAFVVSSLVILSCLRGRIPDWLRTLLAVLAVLAGVTGTGLRVIVGRHFLSDAIFAVLIVLALALILHRLLLARRPAA